MASKCLSGGRSSAARLATNYEWLVNGSVQVGHTQDYLPSENISKGDVVEIRVTASAGEDSVTRQASVTVRNIPPNVQAMLSPELPDTGDDIALSYRVSDADGDDLSTFEIVYMADADPLFHTRIIVLSADNISVLWESAPDYLGRFVEVGNLDDDAGLEIIVSGGHVFDGITYAREWSHASACSADNASQTFTERSVYARDVDGDGLDEIIGILDRDAFDASVEGYSVAKGRMIGNAGPLPSTIFDSRVLSPLAADIDDDGVVEILGVSFAYGSVSAYRYLESTDEFRQVFAREANSVFYAPLVSGIWTATALPSWF